VKSRKPLVPFDVTNAGKPPAALLWEDLEQAPPLEFPDQDKGYFDMFMRFRRHRPVPHRFDDRAPSSPLETLA
jgi:hypothetical protein